VRTFSVLFGKDAGEALLLGNEVEALQQWGHVTLHFNSAQPVTMCSYNGVSSIFCVHRSKNEIHKPTHSSRGKNG
jgi:hypothetical protein